MSRRLAVAAALAVVGLPADAQPEKTAAPFAPAIEAIASRLETRYVEPSIGAQYAAALRAKLARGDYDDLDQIDAAALQLTADLQQVARDLHLMVLPSQCAPRNAPGPGPGGPRPGQPAGPPPRGPQGTPPALCVPFAPYGVRLDAPQPPVMQDPKWAADGVAYVRFNRFPPNPNFLAAVDAFLREHADADALIIDGRTNSGGSPGAVDLIASYLYGEETTLSVLEIRQSVLDAGARSRMDGPGFRELPTEDGLARRAHFITPNPDESGLFDARVYYLTSSLTFSGGENLAFILKSTGRGVIVGERTAGGGHGGGIEDVGQGLAVFVPVTTSFDPVTGEGWDGVGVEPDVAVSADEAFDVALRLATADN